MKKESDDRIKRKRNLKGKRSKRKNSENPKRIQYFLAFVECFYKLIWKVRPNFIARRMQSQHEMGILPENFNGKFFGIFSNVSNGFIFPEILTPNIHSDCRVQSLHLMLGGSGVRFAYACQMPKISAIKY